MIPDAGGADAVIQLGTRFRTAAAVLSAVQLGLFRSLDAAPATADEITERLDIHPRGIRHFLDLLAGLGLLTREDGRYRNTAVAARYSGGFLEGAAHMLYPAWGGLTEALRSGKPGAGADFARMLEHERARHGYLSMMDSLSAPLVPAIDAAVDWAGVGVVGDVGGNRGNLLGLLLGRHPEVTGWVFDLSPHEPDFQRHAERLGVADRASFHGGDFFTDPLPPADLMVVGHVLSNWGAGERRVLLGKAFEAIRPGGHLVVYDPIRDAGDLDPDLLVAGLHMLLMTPGGQGYTTEECAGLLTGAGFDVETVRRAGPQDTVVVARRPR